MLDTVRNKDNVRGLEMVGNILFDRGIHLDAYFL